MRKSQKVTCPDGSTLTAYHYGDTKWMVFVHVPEPHQKRLGKRTIGVRGRIHPIYNTFRPTGGNGFVFDLRPSQHLNAG